MGGSGGSRFGDWGGAMGGLGEGAPSDGARGFGGGGSPKFFFARNASGESFLVNNNAKFTQIGDDVCWTMAQKGGKKYL